MKEMKRVLSLVLCLVMLVSLLPAGILSVQAAEGDPTIVIAGSDYQNTNGGLFSSGAATDAYAILSQIREDYASAYGFLFGGDYYAHSVNTTTESTNGKKQLKEEIVDKLYPDMADDTQIYIQGNHDADSLTTNGTLATSGAHDTDYYGVYVINEKDYMWYNGDPDTIKNTASALKSYLDAKLDEGYSKPIFVLSHLPLHYSTRTVNEGDGKYAKYIYDVLDEAGANDLNIIFLYGHNHSTSYYEAYLGNAAVYLAEGDTIYVAEEGSQSACFSDTLNFTYMNYGFTGYLTGTAADGALTMTVFEIYEDEVQVKRYDASGVHDLKSAGVATNMPSGASANTTVYTSPQTIKLTVPEAKATFTNNGVTVTAAGITAVTAAKEEADYNKALYSGYAVYTVSADDYETGKTAKVTFTLPDGFDTNRTVTVKFPDGHSEEVSVVNGAVTVETSALGTFTLTQKVQTTIVVPGESSDVGTATERTYTRVDSISELVSGGQYLFFFESGNTMMTPVEYTNDSRTGMQYMNSPVAVGGETITGDLESYEFTMESSGSGWLLKADDGYVALTEYSTYDDKKKALTFETTGTVFTITGSSGAYNLYSYFDGENTYFDRNSRGMVSGYSYAESTNCDFYIYRLTATAGGSSVDTSGGDWVTITEPTGGTTTYTYTQATSITAGEEYVIVGNSNAVALMDNNGSMDSQSVTISGTTMTSTTELTQWTFSGASSGTVYNGTRYLRYRSSSFSLSTSSSNLTFTDNGSNFRIQSGNYSFYYNGSSWTRSSNTQYVRLYQLTGTTTTGGTNGLYGKLDGELSYTVPYGTSEDVALQKVKDGIAIKYATASDYSGEATFADDGEGMTWTVVGYDGNTAGEYAVNISYNGTLLGTAKIVVSAQPTSTATVTIDSDSGIVRQNAGTAALTGNKLTITYQDGTTETVNVTVGMIQDADGNAVDTSASGTYTGLKVVYTYNDVEYTICDNYTLTVRENVQNDYPEYPDEGSVEVNKTATGIDFQSSGIAQVELSTSGVPSKKGVDVIVMVDTSSSMKRGAGTNEEASSPNRRIDFLQTAIANLIRQFQTVGDDGEQLDINVAIAEFNGYAFISDEDEPNDSDQQTASNVAQVFTGDGTKTADAFVQATSIADPDAFAANIEIHSGTNYDYAFDTIYRLGAAINAKNAENGEERDLFVIFMSDGAPYGYNYYGSATTDTWDDYLNGNMTLNSDGQIVDDTGVYLKGNTHFYRTDGKHWMAEAIKGSTDQTYMVIDPTDNLGADATAADYAVYSDAGITVPIDGAPDYMRMVSGLGAQMHVIGFCLYDDAQSGGTVYASTQKDLMQRLASTDEDGNVLYHETESGSDLNDIFCEIASSIAYAATNARFVDQMGDDFNLQLETSTYTVVEDGVGVERTLVPVIEVGTYSIYTRQDYLDGKCTEAQIGDRIGSFNLTEVVKFSDDGTKAYSNLIDVDGDRNYGVTVNSDGTYTISDTDDNILDTDGVIYAKSFMYNTGVTAVTVNNIILESEQFYWWIGTVQTAEVALRYYVYLEGSMEGTKEAGSYPTNEYAILYYDNYLGNAAQKDTVSPVMAWKEANVSYAFYLVNESGEIIVNQTTGQTGSFANKIAITNPVVYETVLLNNGANVEALSVAALGEGVLPTYYQIYDRDAVYTVTINSNSTGSWEIVQGNGTEASTYVTQYKTDNASAYSNALTNDTVGDDYTHTVVWFAVVWNIQAHPDTVVIDYGLPVDISVLTNDMFGENGKLAGVGSYSDDLNLDGYDGDLDPDFGGSYTGTYGSAAVLMTDTDGDGINETNTGKVRYTLNSMEMNGYEKFAYAVNYTGTSNPGYYYDTVTVIPATTVYYEESFLTFTGHNADGDTKDAIEIPENGPVSGQWYLDGATVEGATQDEDRPGAYSLTDANNIYGYDKVNNNMTTYSLGSAAKVHVDADSYATAEFKFYGTGFDVIGMTSSDTGILKITVKDKDGTTVDTAAVDTYYGYNYALHNVTYTYTNGEWIDTVGEKADEDAVEKKAELPVEPKEGEVVTAIEWRWVISNSENALYQVPVMQITDLSYGQYTVTLRASYYSVLDKNEADEGYDLYIDAVRIYDPANDGAADDTDDTTIEDAYKADGEGWPSYIELRNKIIEAETLGNADTAVTGLVFIDGDADVGDAQIADYISYGPNNEVYLAPGQRVAFLLSTPENIANIHIGIKSADGNTATWTITNIAKSESDTGEVVAYYGAKTSTVNTTTDMYYDITGYKGDIIVISNTGDRYGTTGILSITNIKSTYTSDPKADVTTSEDGAEENTDDQQSTETQVYMTRSAAMLTLRSLNAAAVEETPEETVPETTEPEVEETVPDTTEPETTEPEETEPEATEPEETEPEETAPETTEPEVEETVPETTEPEVEETVPETTEPKQEDPVEAVKNYVKDIVNKFKDWFGKWFN